MSCDAIKSLFQNEARHGGEATVEAVQLITELVKERRCRVRSSVGEVVILTKLYCCSCSVGWFLLFPLLCMPESDSLVFLSADQSLRGVLLFHRTKRFHVF